MSMKKIYLITFLFLTTISQAQIVNIPDTNFKDALFLNKRLIYNLHGSQD